MDTFRNLIQLLESRQGAKIELEKLPFDHTDLDPVLSSEAISFHYDILARGYVNRYNDEEGDPDFNYAGAILHNLYFPQLMAPKNNNKPKGRSKELIEDNYETFENFKEEFLKVVLSLQGSGWVYLDKKGKIRTINNHQISNNIALLIDCWEHSWIIDYSNMKDAKNQYIKNHWKIINWDIVNHRLG